MRAPAERALDTGGRDVDGVLVQVVPKDVGDALAEPVVDPLRMVDEDGEVVGACELDGQHLDAGQAGLVVIAVSDMGAKVEAAMERADKLEQKKIEADLDEIERDASEGAKLY